MTSAFECAFLNQGTERARGEPLRVSILSYSGNTSVLAWALPINTERSSTVTGPFRERNEVGIWGFFVCLFLKMKPSLVLCT